MGRPCLYHTPEEKAAACNARSKWFYNKNRASINKRQQKQYHQKHKGTPVVGQRTTPSDGNHNGRIITTEHVISIWMEHVESIHKQLTTITGDAPAQFVNQICLDFLADYGGWLG
ncbi:hypothetical protein B0H34DRAFT_675017 [Crassisporium funariophilum]|nr:hypothetical protein B0H34DRAFT_675017 [Crassisporium funariophilum]